MVLVTSSLFESHCKASHIFTAEILKDIKLIFPTQRCDFNHSKSIDLWHIKC